MPTRSRRPRAFWLLAGLLLAPVLRAQPVFTAADFRALYEHPHTLTGYGIGNPDAFAAQTRLTGGPHTFDLTAALLVTGATQSVTPVPCAPSVPGCGQPHLDASSLVLRTREHDDVYLFHDLAEAGFYQRGSAGVVVDEGTGASLEGTLTFESADQTMALPLHFPMQWTSTFSTHLATGMESIRLNDVEAERAVVAWGTLRTAHGEAAVLVVHERRVTTMEVEGQELRDTSDAYRFISPRLRAAFALAADGTVESASIDVYEGAETTSEAPEVLPLVAALHAPHPNPARGATTISFTLDAAASVALDVYDLLGRRVARLAEGVLPPGTHTRTWEAAAPSGSYYVRLQAGQMVLTRQVARVE